MTGDCTPDRLGLRQTSSHRDRDRNRESHIDHTSHDLGRLAYTAFLAVVRMMYSRTTALSDLHDATSILAVVSLSLVPNSDYIPAHKVAGVQDPCPRRRCSSVHGRVPSVLHPGNIGGHPSRGCPGRWKT